MTGLLAHRWFSGERYWGFGFQGCDDLRRYGEIFLSELSTIGPCPWPLSRGVEWNRLQRWLLDRCLYTISDFFFWGGDESKGKGDMMGGALTIRGMVKSQSEASKWRRGASLSHFRRRSASTPHSWSRQYPTPSYLYLSVYSLSYDHWVKQEGELEKEGKGREWAKTNGAMREVDWEETCRVTQPYTSIGPLRQRIFFLFPLFVGLLRWTTIRKKTYVSLQWSIEDLFVGR